jgi:ParB-like chromosome segregation protein Spo0J
MSDILDADAAAADTLSKPRSSWRDYLKVHPAAELFPLMSEPELRELGENIKANGLISPIIALPVDGQLHVLDGRNRLDAMELAGVVLNHKFLNACINGSKNGAHAIQVIEVADPYDYVISANLHRRHLTSEQKRDLIAKVLKAKPEASNRQIAKQVKAHHTTVGTVRAEMESTGEISQLDKTTGADGKKRKKPAKKRAVETDQERRDREECVALYQKVLDAEQRATGSAEISADERRAEMAALDSDIAAHALAQFLTACRTWLPKLATVDEWTEACAAVHEAKERWVKLARAAQS